MKLKKLTLSMIICLIFATTACVRPITKTDIESKPNVETIPSIEAKPIIDTKPSNGIKLAPTEAYSANEFLKFAESYADLSASNQKQTLASTQQVLLANPNDLLHRMKLVMIYGLPSSSLADTPKAQNLLQLILQENILVDSQQAFVHVLFDYIVAINKLSKRSHQDDKLVEQLQSKLESAQQKLEATEQKMNELKNIEKSMGEREILPKEAAPKK